jgi:hypothetical protein
LSSYRRASVLGVKQWGRGIQEAELEFPDGSRGPAVVLTGLVGTVEKGDEVIANTTAVELDLGSGGYHFVLWNLSNDLLEMPSGGHIMKLRYTPLQLDVRPVEEQLDQETGRYDDVGDSLDGIPVIAGSLHSQLIPVALAYKDARPEGRLIYIMTDGGSLPIEFSDTVRFLKDGGYIESTITCGHAFGGDYEAVNIFSAIVASRRVCGGDAAVVVMGPGMVGTGSAVGFSGMEQAIAINATGSMGGRPIAIPRITFADPRERHRGLSHHSVSVLRRGTCVCAIVPVPSLSGEKAKTIWSQLSETGITESHDVREVEAEGVLKLIERCAYNPTVMGRTPQEEPEFFMAAGAAGIVASGLSGGD